MYALLKMDIGEKEVSLQASERFVDDSIVDSQAEDGLSDGGDHPPSQEDEIRETK